MGAEGRNIVTSFTLRLPGERSSRGRPRRGRRYRAARYNDRASEDLADDFRRQLEALLSAAYADHDLDAARAAYAELIDDAQGFGVRSP